MTEHSKPQGPLAGVRVIEMGTLIAGPFGARLLAEFGAGVIKIEVPKKGDPIRNWRVLCNGTSLWWYVQSRNKKCSAPEGLDALKLLLADADVLIENFRPGTLEKWGLTKEVLEEINPKLIVSRVSGFGQTGPYSDRAGFGAVGESMGGIRYLTGYPGQAPTRMGISLGDSVAGLYSVIGILMALYHRDINTKNGQTGEGQVIDVALYEAVFSLMESMVPEYDQKQVIRERTGSVLQGIAPSNVYMTKEGKYAVIAANSDVIVQRLLKLMKRDDLLNDERFSSNEQRVRHMTFIDELIGAWSGTLSLAECLEQLNAHDIPAGPIYSIADIFSDPQYQARDMLLDISHPDFGQLKVPGIIPKLSKTPGAVNWLGPRLGEHNTEVLREIGLSDSQIRKMAEKGII